MNTSVISSFGPIYPGYSINQTGSSAGTLQNGFEQQLHYVTAGLDQVQQVPIIQTSSKVMEFFKGLSATLNAELLPTTTDTLASLSASETLPLADIPAVTSPVQVTSVSEEQTTPQVVTKTGLAEDQEQEPVIVGTATGQSAWYRKVIQPLVDALPAEVRQVYQEAWDQATSVPESAFAQSGGLPGPGVYMYGMTPGGSLIGDWVANPQMSGSTDLGNYTAGAGLFKGTDRAVIEQGVMDTVAFRAANQAILNKYSYDLRAGDIRVGTGDNYTVYNPISGARATINLLPKAQA